MDEKIKATLTNLDTWKRGLFMILFAIISGLAKLIISVVAVFQFITLLFKGQVNEAVIPFGQNLSTYMYQMTLFLTFKTDDMPFPFHAFPDGTPKSKPDDDKKQNIVNTEVGTKGDADIVEEVDVDVKEEIMVEPDTKDTKDTKNDTAKE